MTTTTGDLELNKPDQGEANWHIPINANFDSIDDYITNQILPMIYTIPSGTILMWYGTEETISAGWQICDGTNETPDLRDKFIIGAGSTYTLNATGGAATHTLDVTEIPSHNHTVPLDTTWYVNGNGNSTGGNLRDNGPVNSSYTGGGAAHNNLPPYYAIYYIMKL